MPSKPRYVSSDQDDIIWQKLEEDTDDALKHIRSKETYLAVAGVILKHRNGTAKELHPVIKGGYNIVYRLEYEDGTSIIMRIPIKGVVPFPEEKIRYEVATMKYVAANTTIPVPRVIYHGPASENPTGLGPFMIMEYIEHHHNMSRELLDPTRGLGERPMLNPKVGSEKIEFLYAQMANVLLQLSNLKFPRIGSLVEEQGIVDVKSRPLTSNMIDIVVHTSAPASILPSKTYASADEWYDALADMHMAQLAFQQNDAVIDEDDARDKYTGRQLFRRLGIKKRLRPDPSIPDDFRLFSEDLRPANVLLDKEMRIVGVINWEFAYSAPAQFSFDPPWWLLLEEPDWYPGGYRAWMKIYEPRLQTFLRVMEAEEKKMADKCADNGRGAELVPLSRRMRESWEKRTWMISYAARKSWAFDFLWWKYVDESYFGQNQDQDHKARLELFSEPQKRVMESFVARKIEDQSNKEMIKWEDRVSAEYLKRWLSAGEN
ncbi:phosphotransferase family protein [Hypoxylon sp. FL1284]|nr:phosphotransferase family protein [Hypoxylon sp. FL1284]